MTLSRAALLASLAAAALALYAAHRARAEARIARAETCSCRQLLGRAVSGWENTTATCRAWSMDARRSEAVIP